MSFEFSCYNKKDISRLFCLLMGYDINNLKLKLDPSELSAEELNSLITDLDQLQVPYTRERQDDSDNEELDDEDINMTEDVQKDYTGNFMKLTIPYPEEDATTDVVSKDIEDPEKLFLVRRVIGEAKLVRIVKNYKLGMTLDEKLVLTGNEEDVDQVIFKIINMNYEKSEYLSFDKAKCLKTTLYFRKLKDIYKTKIIIMYDKQAKSFQLAVCGEDMQAVKDCLIKVNEAIERISVFLDLPLGLEIKNEAEEVLEYFKEKYRSKCQDILGKNVEYQISFSENKKKDRFYFYFFSLCPKKDWQLMTEYLHKETKDICFLAALPKENCKITLNAPKDFLDVKLHLTKFENGSCLLIGKAKHFKTHIQELIGMGAADNISYYNIFIRRIPGVKDEKFGQLENFIINRDDPSVYSFLMDQGWETVCQLFEVVDQILRGNQSPEDKSRSFSVISKEKSKGQEGSPEVIKEQPEPEDNTEKDKKEPEFRIISSGDDQEEVKIQDENIEIGLDLQPEILSSDKQINEGGDYKLIPTEDEQQDSINENDLAFDEGAIESDLRISEPTKSENKTNGILADLKKEVSYFGDVNVPKSLFMMDNVEEYEALDEDSELYTQLYQILRKDYPQVEIGEIVKLYNEENWKKYDNRRGNYVDGDVQEYIVLYESADDPVEQVKEDPKEVAGKLIGTFNPNRNKAYVQEDGRYLMLACVALYSQEDSIGILDYYPAFLIDFK